MIKTLKLKVKKPYYKRLNRLAPEVNFVWNYINGLSYYMIRNYKRFLSAYDMHRYLSGACKSGLNISHHTLQAIAENYCTRRLQYKKSRMRWRSKKSLGWLPFRADKIRYKKGYFQYSLACKVKVFDSYGLENYNLRSGSFNQDSKGDWYLNVAVEVPEAPVHPKPTVEIGIDLGLKDFATLSNGEKIESQQFYRDLEPKIAMAQRANKKGLVKSLHKKVQNRRKDFLHKLSNRLTRENSKIFVGNVSGARLAKTKMAKSVLDAGWSQFRTMLEYKAIRRQVQFKVVNEAYTSVTCSSCNGRTGPSGLGELRIREWTCSACGSVHDRDINAAKNILALGHQSLAEGASKEDMPITGHQHLVGAY